MVHVGIMNPKNLIDKILSGEKKIESRWLKNRSAPWNKVAAGDEIYFKQSGGLVVARAIAAEVRQYQDDLSEPIGIMRGYESWAEGKKYCVLVWLADAQAIPKILCFATCFKVF